MQVETEVFDKIDDLVSKGYGDEEYRDMFYETLVILCVCVSECVCTCVCVRVRLTECHSMFLLSLYTPVQYHFSCLKNINLLDYSSLRAFPLITYTCILGLCCH